MRPDEQSFFARARAKIMVHGEESDVRRLATFSTPARDEISERHAVGTAGHGERDAAVRDKRCEGAARFTCLDGHGHQQPTLRRSAFAWSRRAASADEYFAPNSAKVLQAASFSPSAASAIPSFSRLSGALSPDP